MPYSWGLRHSLLFIDNPVGTGFSFTDDDRGYATNQTTVRNQMVAKMLIADQLPVEHSVDFVT